MTVPNPLSGETELVDDATRAPNVTDRKHLPYDQDRLIMHIDLATRAARVGIWDWDIGTNAIVWDPMMFSLYGFADAAFAPVYERWAGALHSDDRAR